MNKKYKQYIQNILMQESRKNFHYFARRISKEYDPLVDMQFPTYVMGCEVLEAFVENRLFVLKDDIFIRVDNAFLNACPGWGKSYIATRLLSIWYLAKYHLINFIITASEKNRKKTMFDISILLQSKQFKNVFKDFFLLKNNDSEKVSNKHGWLNMNPSRSDITGNRGNLFIFDDFDKPTHVGRREFETSKDFLKMYLTRGFKNQIMKMLVVMQRISFDDTTGYLQNIFNNGNIPYVEIKIPYKFIEDTTYTYYIINKETKQIEKKEWLFKKDTFSNPYFNEEKWNSEVFWTECQGDIPKRETQYQQNPIRIEGSYIHKEDLQNRYEENQLSLVSKRFFDYIYISMDTASKTKSTNDYSAFVCVGEKNGFFYILDMYRQKHTSPVLLNEISDFYFKWAQFTTPILLIEDKSSGEGLIQWIQNDGLTCRKTNIKKYPILEPIKVTIGKEEKLKQVLFYFKSKRILLPKHAEWLVNLENELYYFPNVKHDDQLDAIINCLKYIKDIPLIKSNSIIS